MGAGLGLELSQNFQNLLAVLPFPLDLGFGI
jgi:hypothetical protein